MITLIDKKKKADPNIKVSELRLALKSIAFKDASPDAPVLIHGLSPEVQEPLTYIYTCIYCKNLHLSSGYIENIGDLVLQEGVVIFGDVRDKVGSFISRGELIDILKLVEPDRHVAVATTYDEEFNPLTKAFKCGKDCGAVHLEATDFEILQMGKSDFDYSKN